MPHGSGKPRAAEFTLLSLFVPHVPHVIKHLIHYSTDQTHMISHQTQKLIKPASHTEYRNEKHKSKARQQQTESNKHCHKR